MRKNSAVFWQGIIGVPFVFAVMLAAGALLSLARAPLFAAICLALAIPIIVGCLIARSRLQRHEKNQTENGPVGDRSAIDR